MQNHFIQKTASRLFRRKSRAITLVELMVSVVLFAMVSLVLLLGLTQAYRLSALVKYQDQARFILTTVSDQFLRAGYRLSDGPPKTVRPLFQDTGPTPTGVGLGWDTTYNMFSYPPAAITGTSAGMDVPLGQSNQSSNMTGHVTRTVQMVNVANGTTVGATATAAGFILRGDFTITFRFMGRDYTQTTTVVRGITEQ